MLKGVALRCVVRVGLVVCAPLCVRSQTTALGRRSAAPVGSLGLLARALAAVAACGLSSPEVKPVVGPDCGSLYRRQACPARFRSGLLNGKSEVFAQLGHKDLLQQRLVGRFTYPRSGDLLVEQAYEVSHNATRCQLVAHDILRTFLSRHREPLLEALLEHLKSERPRAGLFGLGYVTSGSFRELCGLSSA